jgi:hypothetical protein
VNWVGSFERQRISTSVVVMADVVRENGGAAVSTGPNIVRFVDATTLDVKD